MLRGLSKLRSIKLAENKGRGGRMRRTVATSVLIVIIAALLSLGGCSSQNTPKGTVFRFINATRFSDRAEFEKTLSFERLIIDSKGEAYLAMPKEKKKEELLDFKLKLLDELTSGRLKVLASMEPGLSGEKITGDEAEVKITDKKNKDMAFVFLLARENGEWKVYRISKV